MGIVSFRTLGDGAAHDPDLGARTPERPGHHDLAGGYGAWGSYLGFGSDDSRSKLHFALGGGSVPGKSGSGAPAFDQCCRIKRSHPNSTHRRIGHRLNALEKNDEQHTSRKWNNGRSADFHRTCLWFCHGPLPRLPEADTNPGAVADNRRETHKEAEIRFRVACSVRAITDLVRLPNRISRAPKLDNSKVICLLSRKKRQPHNRCRRRVGGVKSLAPQVPPSGGQTRRRPLWASGGQTSIVTSRRSKARAINAIRVSNKPFVT